MIIDLRSDTVTKPTAAMKEAMFQAPVGDDVFAEDPTVNRLQNLAAEMFGMEAALFCPSGTMTNQIAIKVHTQPGNEIICHRDSHIYCYEGGGLAFNAGVQVRLLDGNNGKILAGDIPSQINPGDSHYAPTTLLAVENTTNRGGGGTYTIEELRGIGKVANEFQLAYHLDGARLFNALIANKEDAKEYGSIFNSISICLSKGLGCPVGSLVLGDRNFIRQAHRYRKMMGGGMRQVGFLAAAGIYALENHITRLADDHRRTALIAKELQNHAWCAEMLPCETNILIFGLANTTMRDNMLHHLDAHGIKALAFSPTRIRFVLHLEVDDQACDKIIDTLQKF